MQNHFGLLDMDVMPICIIIALDIVITLCFSINCSTVPKHRSTHISNYQSSVHKSNQHDESDQMKFPCTLKNTLLIIRNRFGLSFASKGLGYLAALLLLLSLLARYKIPCYQTTLLLTISALADITLLKTTCHILLLLVGFDTLTYRKDLQLNTYFCGSSERARAMSCSPSRASMSHPSQPCIRVLHHVYSFTRNLKCQIKISPKGSKKMLMLLSENIGQR